MSDRPGAVADAREIGRRSYAKPNLTLVLTFDAIGVPAAATGLVHPTWAMAATAASMAAVLANSFAGRLVRRTVASRRLVHGDGQGLDSSPSNDWVCWSITGAGSPM